MILRIRTNLGMTKITVEDERTMTLEQLLKLIIEKLNISNVTRSLILTYDLVGERPLQYRSLQQPIAELGLRHGDELFVKGKFEEIVVEKSYVNEQHELVKAGKSLRLIEEPEESREKEEVVTKEAPLTIGKKEPQPKADSVMEEIDLSSLKSAPPVNSKPSTTPQPVVPSLPPSSAVTSSSSASTPPRPSAKPKPPLDDDENIRAPDSVRKMKLIDFPSPSRDFTPAEMEQLTQYRNQLREAGLKEYEIEQMIQEMKDELLVERMKRQMVLEDQMSYQRMSSLDELEQLLARQRRPTSFTENNHRTTAGSDTNRIYRPNYSKEKAGRGVSGSGGHKRKLIDEFRLNDSDDSLLPVISSGASNPSRGNNSTASNTNPTTGRNNASQRLQGAGEMVLQGKPLETGKSSSKSSSSVPYEARKRPVNTYNTPNLMEVDREQVVDLIDDNPVPAPSLSLRESHYQPFSAYHRRGEADRSQAIATPNASNEDQQFEEAMRKAIEESLKQVKPSESQTSKSSSSRQSSGTSQRRATAAERKPSSSSTTMTSSSNHRVPVKKEETTSGNSSSSRTEMKPPASNSAASNSKPSSTSRSSRVSSSVSTQKVNPRVEQHISDEEAARKLQEEEDRAFALMQQQQDGYDREERQTERQVLRDVLHNDHRLPQWLDESLNRDLTNDLVEIVRGNAAHDIDHFMNSRMPRNIASSPVANDHAAGGFYDEEDELFARALQNSLNEK